MTLPFPIVPVYFFVFLVIALLYLLAAMALGVVAAVLTVPVLFYSGYGLVPPKMAPASGGVRYIAILEQVTVGAMVGATTIVATFLTSMFIPFWIRYQFARVSPRLETVPALASGLGIVLIGWLAYLVLVRKGFASGHHDDWTTGLLASVRVTLAFAVCFLAVAVLSTFTLYL